MWLYTFVIPAHRRLRREDQCEFKTSLGYIEFQGALHNPTTTIGIDEEVNFPLNYQLSVGYIEVACFYKEGLVSSGFFTFS